MKVPALLVIFIGLASPLYAAQVFYEDFEDAAVGDPLATVVTWTGSSNPVLSSALLDSGQSLDLCGGGGSVGDWPVVQKAFSYTPGSGESYIFSGTLIAPGVVGEYADARIASSSDGSFVQAALGYGKLAFCMWEGGAGSMENLKMEVNVSPQLLTAMDYKLIFESDRTDCYWRATGDAEWTHAGGADYALNLAIYDTITLVGHNVGSTSNGGMDSIRLTSGIFDGNANYVGNIGVFYEDFEGGSAGTPLVGTAPTANWSGSTSPVISSIVLDSGQSLDLCGGGGSVGDWPIVQKAFSYTPGSGESYVFSGTLIAPGVGGEYADARIASSSDGSFVQAALGYGKLAFCMWEGGAGSIENLKMEVNVAPQLLTAMDYKIVLADDKTYCFWRATGDSQWIYAGGADYALGLAIYDTISLVGHNVGSTYNGGMDSISLTSEVVVFKPGDANFDGVVDATDAAALATNWQTQENATWAMGDFNGDGKVDDIDATLLATNWSTPPSASVPEPSSAVMLFSGLLLIALSARKKSL